MIPQNTPTRITAAASAIAAAAVTVASQRLRIIVGGVVVAPRASELIHSVSLAVAQRVTVDDFSHAFTVYPSMSGTVAEAARRLHTRDGAWNTLTN